MKNGVIVKNNTGYGAGTRVFDAKSGREIEGIRSMTIQPIEVDKPIIANMEMYVVAMDIKCGVEKIKEIKFKRPNRFLTALANGFL